MHRRSLTQPSVIGQIQERRFGSMLVELCIRSLFFQLATCAMAVRPIRVISRMGIYCQKMSVINACHAAMVLHTNEMGARAIEDFRILVVWLLTQLSSGKSCRMTLATIGLDDCMKCWLLLQLVWLRQRRSPCNSHPYFWDSSQETRRNQIRTIRIQNSFLIRIKTLVETNKSHPGFLIRIKT